MSPSEFIVVALILACALGFLARRIFRWIMGNGGGHCCGKGCPAVSSRSRKT